MLRRGSGLLIVEDDPTIASMLKELVVALGMEVAAVAHDAAAALMALQSESPSLAVLDVDLGNDTSLEVAAACACRQIPVVFITGLSPEAIPPECANSPVLLKPFSERAFANAVQGAIADEPSGRSAAASVARFWLYFDRDVSRGRVHDRHCQHCNDGRGHIGRPRVPGGAQVWFPFDTLEAAQGALEALPIRDAGCCKSCLPHLVRG